jgi:hypothetical protein
MTIDEDVSSRALRDLLRTLWIAPWPRLFLLSISVIIAVAWTGFVAFRLSAMYSMETALEQERTKLSALMEQYKADRESFDKRLAELEQTLYGSVEPSVQQQAQKVTERRPTSVELWQRNRDAELRKILTDMQRRVLRLENAMK